MNRRSLIAAGALAGLPGLGRAQDAAAPTPAGPAVLAPPAPGILRLNMATGEGLLVLDLFEAQAPLTVANIMRYVDAGRFNRSAIYRAVRAGGASDYGLVQGGARFDTKKGNFKGVEHEPTTRTGIKHLDGTISLAREAPGTGTSDFFICVGDAPYLDANPEAPGDNLGYAAFGRVVQGMDLVRRILTMPTSDKAENPTMRGQMLAQPVPILSTKRA
ncbi:MAG: peptidylprolyl isomerase [Caulobacter sp.]